MKLRIGQETAKPCALEEVQVQDKDKPLHADKQSVSKGFWFLSRSVNPEYQAGLVEVAPRRRAPLRSCLLHHKSDRNWVIKCQPKYFTTLLRTDFNRDTGEVFGQSVYQTNCLSSGNNRKIRALNGLKNAFKEHWERRKVSIFFYTFTIANENGVSISKAFDGLRKRFIRNGHPVRGYCWVLDIDKDSFHIHYHAVVVCDRVNCRGKRLPKWVKMDDIWGARCQVEFGKGFNYYLAKYLAKNNWRVYSDGDGKRKRQYGLKLPKKNNFTSLAER